MLRDTTNQIETIQENILASGMPKIISQPHFKIPRDSKKGGNITADFRAALTSFLNGETLKSGNYVATENALVYRSISTIDGFNQDVLCLKIIQDDKAFYIGNSSRLNVVGTNVAFGRRSRNWGETEPQRVLNRMGVPMLPFQAFTQAGLKVTSTLIIDQGGAESVQRMTRQDKKGKKTFEAVHFTGASLFQNGASYFLFDIDRVEIEHGIFNPFIVELPRSVRSISEAYDSLIPLAVRTAMSEGKTVLRQGEHFFIKVANADAFKPTMQKGWGQNETKMITVPGRLSAQGNRDHVCSLFNKQTGYVSGFVAHQGREHLDLDLTSGWWMPVPNTAVKAFTIAGDID